MSVLVSEAEWTLIRDGAEAGLRCDGRGPEDYRPIRLESGLLNNTHGSARLRLGLTDVLVGVKAQVETPSVSAPSCGRLSFFLDCSANATPEFEGRGGEEIAAALTGALSAAYSSPASLDYSRLCVKEAAFAWTLHVDIVLLQLGGNLYDAVSLAVKAALMNTQLPRVSVLYNEEKEEHELELSDDFAAPERLELADRAPVLLTVAKIGAANLLDPTEEEGIVSKSSLIVGVIGSEGKTVLVQQEGESSLDPESVSEMLALGLKCGQALDRALVSKLKEEEAQSDRVILGFLAD